MVDALVVDNSKHQELGWHNVACILSLICSQKAGLTSESGIHLVTVVTRSAQGSCNLYQLLNSNQSDNSATCCMIGQWHSIVPLS